MADNTLKLCGEPTVPGMALPKAMERIEKNLESVARMGRMKGSSEAQLAGLLAVCEEQQRLLKLAFIENGMLASKMEILTCYQAESCKKFEKRLAAVEMEHKVTKRHLRQLRKKLSDNEALRRKKESRNWWSMNVSCSDYNSLTTLARSAGLPDLDFMLRLNQLMIDFVKDSDLSEILLPPMGTEERTELSKLASIYRLRCRFNKSTQVGSSTLIKARQTCIPGPGEVDSVLNSFSIRRQKDLENTTATSSSPNADQTQLGDSSQDTPSSLPSYMLTPVSSYGTPTITLEVDPLTSLQVYPPVDESKSAIASENPFDLLPSKISSAIRAAQPGLVSPTLMQVVESSQRNPSVLLSPYPSLLAGAAAAGSGLSSQTNALHLALLNQTQQMRSLGILPSASSAQPATGSGVSTVVASPLPPTLSAQQQTPTTKSASLSNKREPSSSKQSSSKRSRWRRNTSAAD